MILSQVFAERRFKKKVKTDNEKLYEVLTLTTRMDKFDKKLELLDNWLTTLDHKFSVRCETFENSLKAKTEISTK